MHGTLRVKLTVQSKQLLNIADYTKSCSCLLYIAKHHF